MIRRCVEAGLPEPQFGYRDGCVLSIFGPRLREFESSGKSSGNMRQKILRMIGNDAEITTAEMASRSGVTRRTVEKQVRMLREEGVPGRAGPAKGGHWALME
jgi:ATP-dependent DNA helicase RecG